LSLSWKRPVQGMAQFRRDRCSSVITECERRRAMVSPWSRPTSAAPVIHPA